jgi:hypothetical protein
MNPEVLRIEIPTEIDPIEVLIKDQTRFFHALGQHANIAWPGLDERRDDVIRTIALAAGSVVNQRVLYHFFLPYMPDGRARGLLEDLLGKMDILVESTFGRTIEEMQPLGHQRKQYVTVMDNILMAYSALTDYLKSKTTE